MLSGVDTAAGTYAPDWVGARDAGRLDAVASASEFRADIQGLRALAVSLVLVFHLFPSRLTGGYIGVDAFFVISGFLITAHLVAKPPRSARDLASFWGRRIRRLLPASLLVLLVTLAVSRLVAPETQWANTALDIRSATLYVVNWRLADRSVDYLSQEDAASPAQHFWSLSVEEQFYLVWPLLILAVVVSAAAWRREFLSALLVALGVVVAASFAYSVWETATDPQRAYFVTPTRMWELGIGGLLAVLLARRARLGRSFLAADRPAWVRSALVIAGLVAIVVPAIAFNSVTPFPGWQAGLPVLGCALLIGIGPPRRQGPLAFLLTNPVAVWLGGISYSIYLWHWPLIVLLPAVSGGSLGILDKAAIVVATLVLATLTKIFVEDRFRRPRPLPSTYALAAAGMACLVALSAVQIAEVDEHQRLAELELTGALAGDQRCFGANALAPDADCPIQEAGSFVPAPAAASRDRSSAYDEPCIASDRVLDFRSCTYGAEHGDVTVALIGNSHAVHWLPALDQVATTAGWRVTTYLVSGCRASFARNVWPTQDLEDRCFAWGQWVLADVTKRDFDLLLIANSKGGSLAKGAASEAESRELLVAGDRRYLEALAASGSPVAVLRGIPRPPAGHVPDCVAAHRDDLLACAGSRSDAIDPDSLEDAAGDMPATTVDVIDLNDYFCTDDVCPAVVGGVLVYSDTHHMTATYAKTLARYLAAPLREILARTAAG